MRKYLIILAILLSYTSSFSQRGRHYVKGKTPTKPKVVKPKKIKENYTVKINQGKFTKKLNTESKVDTIIDSNFDNILNVDKGIVDIVYEFPLKKYVLTSKFGYRIHPISGEYKMHDGVDLAAPKNTPVYAIADGIVIKVKRKWSGYGKYIVIDHGNGLTSKYAHLNGFAIRKGEKITKGQLIGYVGSTGSSTGNHLHFELRLNNKPFDPFELYKNK